MSSRFLYWVITVSYHHATQAVCSLLYTGTKMAKQLTPNAETAIKFWIHRGWRPHVAFAITAHMQIESYSDLRTTVVGDKHIKAHNGIPEGSYGICQWNSARKMALFSYAARQNKKPSDLELQLEFCAYELNTTEKFAGNELAKSTTIYGATRAFMHFERPRGYTRFWPTLGSHWDKRLAAAIKLDKEWYAKYPAMK